MKLTATILSSVTIILSCEEFTSYLKNEFKMHSCKWNSLNSRVLLNQVIMYNEAYNFVYFLLDNDCLTVI